MTTTKNWIGLFKNDIVRDQFIEKINEPCNKSQLNGVLYEVHQFAPDIIFTDVTDDQIEFMKSLVSDVIFVKDFSYDPEM